MQLMNIKEMKRLRKEIYKNSQKLAKLLALVVQISRWECGMSPISKSHGLMVEDIDDTFSEKY